MGFELIDALEACREAEKEQALFYRGLAALAEELGDETLANRFQELHADEQHHLSRLTARLVELGHLPSDLSGVRVHATPVAGWEEVSQRREEDEIHRYETLLTHPFDPQTRARLEEILEVERSHARELGGKWTMA